LFDDLADLARSITVVCGFITQPLDELDLPPLTLELGGQLLLRR
jgi:hypothetical protein